MKHFEWRLVSMGHGDWRNHLHPSFFQADHFTAICGQRAGGTNGEGKTYPYCAACLAGLDEREAKAEKAAQTVQLTYEKKSRVFKLALKPKNPCNNCGNELLAQVVGKGVRLCRTCVIELHNCLQPTDPKD